MRKLDYRNRLRRLFQACLPLLAMFPGSAQNTPTTPIKHVVVIFQENVSFDHYFAAYPVAANSGGEPVFVARRNTPTVNGLSGPLLTNRWPSADNATLQTTPAGPRDAHSGVRSGTRHTQICPLDVPTASTPSSPLTATETGKSKASARTALTR